METRRSLKADIVALDQDDIPVLLVEVTHPQLRDSAKRQLLEYLQRMLRPVPYAMLVDRQALQIFAWRDNQLSAPLYETETANILSFYDPEFPDKEIYQYYLATLVEAWLRDIAYHWKSQTPPAYEELRQIGLAQLLHEGTTQAEYPIAA